MRRFGRIYLFVLIAAICSKSGRAQVLFTPDPPKLNTSAPYAEGLTTPLVTDTKCATANPHRYDDDVCYLTANIARPGSPLAVSVPKITVVQVRVRNRPDFSTVQTVTTVDEVNATDFGNAFVKLFLPGLQMVAGRNMHFQSTGQKIPFALEESQQNELLGAMTKLKHSLDNVTNEASEIKKHNYAQIPLISASFHNDRRGPDDPQQEPRCKNLEASALFDCARQVLIDDAMSANALVIPQGLLSIVDSELKFDLPACSERQGLKQQLEKTKSAEERKALTMAASEATAICLRNIVRLQNNQADLMAAIPNLQAQRKAILDLASAVASVPHQGDYVYEIHAENNRKATLVITSKDVFTGTSTAIATATVTWQGTVFSLSTGLLISAQVSRTFANGPVYANGLPSKDGSGNQIYSVTEADVTPSFVTPLAFVNYELPWGYSVNGRFGIDASVGLGANLTTKEADYAAGLGVRYRDLLVTPVAHFGRDLSLSNGIYVGDPNLGSASSVPTEQHFKPHFGFAVTYRIPIP